MDLNEQMKYLVGVAQSNHSAAASAKPTSAIVNVPGNGWVNAGAAVANHKPPPHSGRREKVKKAHRDTNKKPAVSDSRSQEKPCNTPRLEKKNFAIRGSNLLAGKVPDNSIPPSSKEKFVEPVPHVKPATQVIVPPAVPVVPGATESALGIAARIKKEKVRKKKKNSPTRVKHLPGLVQPVSNNPAPPSHPLPPEPTKQRPEELSLFGHGSTPLSTSSESVTCLSGHSDAPDTKDVQFMLDQLLHPPPLSLVTPIPTPSTFKPFVFPAFTSATQVSMNGPRCL